ncbi:kinesin-like protein KIF18A [Acipenser ruthenus]|uniref:kinesin-like protein KIF18A n=1 Tax=Acipenser ruthenus TaxID=7906 RepID=UPI001560691C|nr:kinesin-like protein KIF18A [Acipenser ruthenus]XP_058857891.1 kinesin-like protein KIF18A [Acipenser ruthenus]
MSASGSDVCSHVKVVVRVRPENQKEGEGNFRTVVHVVDNHMLVFDPKEQEVSFFRGQKIKSRDINKRANKDLKFVFDNVFGGNSTQQEVFENTTKGLLDGVLNGYNCTVLAYGATGAGKTHTMLGSPNEPGVMYLTMKELYNRIEQVKDDKTFDIAVSYLEVYNEQIRDLLVNSGPLAVREDGIQGVVVQGLTLSRPKSAEHILEALDYGNRNRTQHPTDVNASSSRSHAVFQIYVRQQDRTASINQNVKIAKMCLIDLAGSERASATNSKGVRFREGANINRSLLALGNIINALADPKNKKAHIPYRNSKLTRLLKDSLGGNCRTVMIANVSPSAMSYDDTYNTLKYANRAKDIKSSLKSNVVSLDSHISQYAVICEQQKREILMLKEKLKQYEEKKVVVPESRRLSLLAISNQKQTDLEKMEESLKSVFTNRVVIRKEFLDLEKQLKANELKAAHREQCHQQVQLLCSNDKAEKATCKRERRMAALATHRLHMKRKLKDVQQRFEENDNWLHRVENEMRLLGQDAQIPKMLQKDLDCHHSQLEVLDLKQRIEHITYLIGLQDQENKQNEKILNSLLPAFRRQYETLKEAGLASFMVESEFKELEHLVLRERGVVWADQPVPEEPQHHPNSQQELSSIISFSHLVCHQNTPCSAERHKRKSLRKGRLVEITESPLAREKCSREIEDKSKENILPSTDEPCQVPSHKPTRRKLVESPLAQVSATIPCASRLDDSLSNEGVYPILYTPEICRAQPTQDACRIGEFRREGLTTNKEESPRLTGSGTPCATEDGTGCSSIPLNLTFNLTDDCGKADCDATVILSPGSSKLETALGSAALEQGQESSKGSSILQRLGLPSLLNNNNKKSARSGKPSYMGMTSAAERKRNLSSCMSLTSLRGNMQGPSAPKRVKIDNAPGGKPLRVRRLGEQGEESDPGRMVVRSFSEGNLQLVGVKGQKSKFIRPANLLKKQMKKP